MKTLPHSCCSRCHYPVPFLWLSHTSVMTVLTFQISPSFGAEVLLSAVPTRYQFWALLLKTSVTVQGFQGFVVCIILITQNWENSDQPYIKEPPTNFISYSILYQTSNIFLFYYYFFGLV